MNMRVEGFCPPKKNKKIFSDVCKTKIKIVYVVGGELRIIFLESFLWIECFLMGKTFYVIFSFGLLFSLNVCDAYFQGHFFSNIEIVIFYFWLFRCISQVFFVYFLLIVRSIKRTIILEELGIPIPYASWSCLLFNSKRVNLLWLIRGTRNNKLLMIFKEQI